jgi:serine/threonine protein kinase
MHNFDGMTGMQIDGYRLDMLVSQCGTGAVFKAGDMSADLPVVLNLISKGTGRLSLKRVQEKDTLLLESEAAIRLSSPFLARVYAMGETDVFYYACSEVVTGMPLAQVFAENKTLEAFTKNIPKGMVVFEQVLLALDAIHRSGMFHRNLDPSQIMITDDKEAVLLFCPLQALTDSSSLTTVKLQFIVSYNSPEQVKGLPIDIRSNIFSLGAILYHALTGKAPFAGVPGDVVKKLVELDTPSILDFNSEIPQSLDAICRKALMKDQAGRYQTPTEMLKDIKSVLDVIPAVRSDLSDADSTVRLQPAMPVTFQNVLEAELLDQDELSSTIKSEVIAPDVIAVKPSLKSELSVQTGASSEELSPDQIAPAERHSKRETGYESKRKTKPPTVVSKRPFSRVVKTICFVLIIIVVGFLALFLNRNILPGKLLSLLPGTSTDDSLSSNGSGPSIAMSPRSSPNLEQNTVGRIIGLPQSPETGDIQQRQPSLAGTYVTQSNPEKVAPADSGGTRPLTNLEQLTSNIRSVEDTVRISIGMTPEQVLEILGDPWQVKKLPRSIEWEYPTPKGLFEARFRNGTVVYVGFARQKSEMMQDSPLPQMSEKHGTSRRLDVTTFDLIHNNMTTDQVRQLVGGPDWIEEEANSVSWKYHSTQSNVRVKFVNGRVVDVKRH